MLKYNKKVFFKFFSIYFGSVAFLIIIFGGIYFQLNIELIQSKSISHAEMVQMISDAKIKVISTQIVLMIVFGLISFYLSMRSIKPLHETLQKLDNFSKDIIHDINTPITNIMLNLKLMEKKGEFMQNTQLERIKTSALHIKEIQNNLTALLQENSLKVQDVNLVSLIGEIVDTHKKLYPDIIFKVDKETFIVEVNKDAITQILTNLISNACKYNSKNGVVKIYSNGKTLFIEDFGIGIKDPKKIFERSYKENKNGHGIGLDIVKRLCDAMDVKVSVKQKNSMGSIFALEF